MLLYTNYDGKFMDVLEMYVEFSLMPQARKAKVLELVRKAKNDFSFSCIDEFDLESSHELAPLLPQED